MEDIGELKRFLDERGQALIGVRGAVVSRSWLGAVVWFGRCERVTPSSLWGRSSVPIMTTVVTEGAMQEIQLREAKATLSAVIDQARRGEPSIITRHGRPEAVLLSFEEWQRLSQVPSFGRLLMAAPLEPDDVPARQDGLRDAEL